MVVDNRDPTSTHRESTEPANTPAPGSRDRVVESQKVKRRKLIQDSGTAADAGDTEAKGSSSSWSTDWTAVD